MTLPVQEKRQRQVQLTKKRKLDEIVKKMKAYGLTVEEIQEHFDSFVSVQETIVSKRAEMLTIKKRRESLEKAREARKQKLEEKRNG